MTAEPCDVRWYAARSSGLQPWSSSSGGFGAGPWVSAAIDPTRQRPASAVTVMTVPRPRVLHMLSIVAA